jgi:formamidopyrimidine-DNA glycosylase
MAGGFEAPGDPGARLVSQGKAPRRAGWPPRFAKLELGFDDGGLVAMTDARRLGRIRLRGDPRAEPPISRLGWDALRELPPASRFAALLRARRAPVKAVLLDQAFSAGVGNWIADEVLYQAGIAPQRRASALTRAEADRLRRAIRAVVGTAVRAGSDSQRFPPSWLFHYRWGRRPDARDARGRPIRRATVGGRSTAWVPAAQR